MNKYKILVEEYMEGVYEESASTFHDARNILENKINSGEIVIENTHTYKRTLKNYNSKELKEHLNLQITFDPELNMMIIINNNDDINEYYCDTVRDLEDIFKYYCDKYLENDEFLKENDELNL